MGAVAVTTFTVTEPEKEIPQIVRIPDSINQGSPPSLQMYRYIKAYADTFNIPVRFAFGIANIETGYRGPFHWKYNPSKISSSGAVGPMQVMVSTARHINRDRVSKEKLRTDIKYNIYTSMKLLRKLYNIYGNWKTVFGAYNTGRPCINGYAHKVYNHKLNW